MAKASTRIDRPRGVPIDLEIAGALVASFSEVSGLTSDGDAVNYREGEDARESARKLAGLRKYGTITLKRGYAPDKVLWDWYEAASRGAALGRGAARVLLPEATLRFHFDDAWINKIEAPSLPAAGNEIAIDSLELVYQSVTVARRRSP